MLNTYAAILSVFWKNFPCQAGASILLPGFTFIFEQLLLLTAHKTRQ